jgi:hypothetical protein
MWSSERQNEHREANLTLLANCSPIQLGAINNNIAAQSIAYFSQADIEAVDGGAGNGTLVIGTAALSGSTGVLSAITLQKPSFSFAMGAATMLGAPLVGNIVATGTAALAELRASDGTTQVSGLTVGVSMANVDLSTTDFQNGEIVTINDGTLYLG